MAFLESPRLDDRITRGAKFSLLGSRTKVYTQGGGLKQQFNWALAKHQVDLSHGVRTRADYTRLLDFFCVVMFAPYEGFRVKNWADFLLTQSNSVVYDLGAGTTFQIARLRDVGGGATTYVHPVRKPVSGSITIYRTRTGSVTTASATVDYTTGIATISGHVSGDTYTAAGEYDLPMTFVNDEWAGTLEVHTENLHLESMSILCEELKAPDA